MKKLWLGITAVVFAALFAVVIQPAYPADAPVYKGQVSSVAAPAGDPWTGFYGQIGWNYGWSDSNPSITDPTVSGFSNSCKGKNCTTPLANASSSLSDYTTGGINQRDSGSMIGGGVGYDQRFGRFLIGAEAEWYKSWITGSSIVNSSQITREIKSVGLLTGRVGFLIDPRNLVYVKGGGAWRDETITVAGLGSGRGGYGGSSSDPIVGYAGGQSSNTVWGWALGGGWENILVSTNTIGTWRLRLEGMYMKFPDQDTAVSGSITIPQSKGPPTVGSYASNVHTNDAISYVGVKAIWHPWN